MILPGETTFKGVVGTTFDAITTIYLIEVGSINFQTPIIWESTKQYSVNSGVVSSANGEAYKCIKTNIGQNPVIATEFWELIIPLNLTSYTAEMKINSSTPVILKGGEGLTLGGKEGTIAIEMTPEQTKKMIAGSTHFSLLLTQPSKRLYEYLKGSIEWQEE